MTFCNQDQFIAHYFVSVLFMYNFFLGIVFTGEPWKSYCIGKVKAVLPECLSHETNLSLDHGHFLGPKHLGDQVE